MTRELGQYVNFPNFFGAEGVSAQLRGMPRDEVEVRRRRWIEVEFGAGNSMPRSASRPSRRVVVRAVDLRRAAGKPTGSAGVAQW